MLVIVVAVVQGGADPGGGGLFADVEVQRAAHFGGEEGLLSRLLKAADAPHDEVDPAEFGVIQRLERAVGGSFTRSATVGGDRLLLCQGTPPFRSGRSHTATAGPSRFTVPEPEYIRAGRRAESEHGGGGWWGYSRPPGRNPLGVFRPGGREIWRGFWGGARKGWAVAVGLRILYTRGVPMASGLVS